MWLQNIILSSLHEFWTVFYLEPRVNINLYLAPLMHECPFQTLDTLHSPLEYRKELFHLGIAHKTPRRIDHRHRPIKVSIVAIQKL